MQVPRVYFARVRGVVTGATQRLKPSLVHALATLHSVLNLDIPTWTTLFDMTCCIFFAPPPPAPLAFLSQKGPDTPHGNAEKASSEGGASKVQRASLTPP